MKKKKISLRKIILLLMILGCLTSAVAIILTSYSSLQLMNQNNIEDNMEMNLYQFTKESDEAYYKLLRVLNQMSADGMVGSAVDKYLTQEEHYDQYINKKTLRAQLVSLNSSSPGLLIAFYLIRIVTVSLCRTMQMSKFPWNIKEYRLYLRQR